jgi:hypothetical protein
VGKIKKKKTLVLYSLNSNKERESEISRKKVKEHYWRCAKQDRDHRWKKVGMKEISNVVQSRDLRKDSKDVRKFHIWVSRERKL